MPGRGLAPAECRNSIFEIDLEALKAQGIRAILLDLDNTMVGWNHPDPTPGLLQWLEQIRSEGFQACIVSNNSGSRVSRFAARVGIPFVPRATKPRRKGFRAAMRELGVRPDETAVVGDQIFTDVLGGNRAGAYTILVVPLHPQEFVGTKVVRFFERFVLRYMDHKGLLIRK